MKLAVETTILTATALDVIEMINDNVQDGVDMDGKPLAPYSEKTFARPFSPDVPKRGWEALRATGAMSIFTTKRGRLWAAIKGGYKAFKAAVYPKRKNDFLQARGVMMQALTVIRAGDNVASVGFATAEAAEIATFHQISGAGKAKTLRKFFGIRPEQREELARKIEARLAQSPAVRQQITTIIQQMLDG